MANDLGAFDPEELQQASSLEAWEQTQTPALDVSGAVALDDYEAARDFTPKWGDTLKEGAGVVAKEAGQFFSNVGTGLGKSVLGTVKEMDIQAGKLVGEEPSPQFIGLLDKGLETLNDWERDSSNFYKGSSHSKIIGSAVGSAASYAIPSMGALKAYDKFTLAKSLPGIFSKATQAVKAKKGADEALSVVEVLRKTNQIVERRRQLAAVAPALVMGMAGNAHEARQDAIGKFATLEEQDQAAAYAGIFGVTEVVPLERAFKVFKRIDPGLSQKFLESTLLAGAEVVQEVFTNVMQNMAASDWVGYDPSRPLFEGAEESAEGAAGAATILYWFGRAAGINLKAPKLQDVEQAKVSTLEADGPVSVLTDNQVRLMETMAQVMGEIDSYNEINQAEPVSRDLTQDDPVRTTQFSAERRTADHINVFDRGPSFFTPEEIAAQEEPGVLVPQRVQTVVPEEQKALMTQAQGLLQDLVGLYAPEAKIVLTTKDEASNMLAIPNRSRSPSAVAFIRTVMDSPHATIGINLDRVARETTKAKREVLLAESIGHEFGHYLLHQYILNAPKSVREALWTDYTKYLQQMEGATVADYVRSSEVSTYVSNQKRHGMKKMEGHGTLEINNKPYSFSIEEYFARMMGSYVSSTSGTANPMLAEHFQAADKLLRRFYDQSHTDRKTRVREPYTFWLNHIALEQAYKQETTQAYERAKEASSEIGRTQERVQQKVDAGEIEVAAEPVVFSMKRSTAEAEAIEQSLENDGYFVVKALPDEPGFGVYKARVTDNSIFDQLSDPVVANWAKGVKTNLGDSDYALAFLNLLPSEGLITKQDVLQAMNRKAFRQNMRKEERQVIETALKALANSTGEFSVNAFRREVLQQVVPLMFSYNNEYADVGLSRIRRGYDERNPRFGLRGEEYYRPISIVMRTPFEVSGNNHFGDPNYFSHMRVFREGINKQFIMEIQSDYFQRLEGNKQVTPEEREQAKVRAKKLNEATNLWNVFQRLGELVEELLIEDTSTGIAHEAKQARIDDRLERLSRLSKDQDIGPLYEQAENMVNVARATNVTDAQKEHTFYSTMYEVSTWLRPQFLQTVDLQFSNARRIQNHLDSWNLRPAKTLSEKMDRVGEFFDLPIEELYVDYSIDLSNVVAKDERLTHYTSLNALEKTLRMFMKEQARDVQNSEVMLATAETLDKVEGWNNHPDYEGIRRRHRKLETLFKKEYGATAYTDEEGHTWLRAELQGMNAEAPTYVFSGSETIRSSQIMQGIARAVETLDSDGLAVETRNQIQLEQDKFNRFGKVFGTLLQIAEENPHIENLQVYKDLSRAMHNERMHFVADIDVILQEWDALGSRGDLLARFMIDQSAAYDRAAKRGQSPYWWLPDRQMMQENPTLLADPKVRERVERIKRKYKLDDDMVELYLNLRDSLRKAIGSMEQALVTDAKKRLRDDPGAMALRVKAIRKDFADMMKRPYFPLSRFGKYTLTVRTNKERTLDGIKYHIGDVVHFEQFETEHSLAGLDYQGRNARMKELKAAFPAGEYTIKKGVLTDTQQSFAGMPTSLLRNAPEKLGLNEKQVADLEAWMHDLAPGQSFRKHMKERKALGGYSLDGKRAYAQYMRSFAGHLTRAKYQEQMLDAIKGVKQNVDDYKLNSEGEIDADKRLAIYEWMQKHYKYQVNPAEEWAALRSIGFMWYIGFIPKSAVVNLTQIPMATYPVLAAMYNDVKAVGAINVAMKDVMRAFTTGKGLTVAEQEVIEQAHRDGFLDESLATYLADVAEGSILQHTVGGTKVDNAIRYAGYAGAYLFQKAEKFNRHVSFLATFRLAQKAGLSTEASYKQARDVVDKSQFEYAGWNRAEFMRGKKSVLFLFWQYMQNMLYLSHRGHAGTSGVVPRVWMMMFLLGGASGLPWAENIMDLYNFIGRKLGISDRDVRSLLRDYVNKLGHEWGSFFMHGISKNSLGLGYFNNLLQEPVIPEVDLSGSVSMGRIIPGTEVLPALASGVDFNSTFTRLAEEAGGAVYSAAIGIFRAIQDDNPEAFRKWEKAMPTAIKHLMKSYYMAAEGKTVRADGSTLRTWDMDNAKDRMEVIAQALGFAPTDVNDQRTAEWAAKQVVQFLEYRRRLILRDYDYALLQGDRETLAIMNKRVAAYNKDVIAQDYPEFTIKAAGLRQSLKQKMADRYAKENFLDPDGKGTRILQKELETYGVRMLDEVE